MPHTINVPAGGGPLGASPDAPDALGAGGGSEERPLQILSRMIADAKQYINVEPDAEDRSTMGNVLRTLLQYQAKDQRDRDAALGGGPATRILRKSLTA